MNNSKNSDNAKSTGDRYRARRLGVVLATLFAFTATVAFTATGARAADYPSRPIRAVVPFGPGGLTDIAARLIAQEMGKELKQTIYVENRAGALGSLGMAEVARTPADGYTVMVSGSASTMNPAMFRSLNYDPVKDLRAVGMISQSPYVVVVNSKVPVTTLDGLIKHVLANPGKLNVAFSGAGTTLAIELLMMQHNLKSDLVLVPYKDGASTALAVAQGDAQFSILDISAIKPFLTTGQIKVLSVSGDQRLSILPDVPTNAEAGFANFNPSTNTALFVPSGTPDSVVNLLNAALNKVLKSPEVKQRIEEWGGLVTPMDPAKANAWYTDEIALWKEVVAKAKMPLI